MFLERPEADIGKKSPRQLCPFCHSQNIIPLSPLYPFSLSLSFYKFDFSSAQLSFFLSFCVFFRHRVCSRQRHNSRSFARSLSLLSGEKRAKALDEYRKKEEGRESVHSPVEIKQFTAPRRRQLVAFDYPTSPSKVPASGEWEREREREREREILDAQSRYPHGRYPITGRSAVGHSRSLAFSYFLFLPFSLCARDVRLIKPPLIRSPLCALVFCASVYGRIFLIGRPEPRECLRCPAQVPVLWVRLEI